MIKLGTLVLALSIILGSVESAVSQGNIISNVLIDEYTISPDGDGIQDSLIITYTLSDTAFFLEILVRSSDSSTVVLDTIQSPISTGAGTYTASWKGEDSGGSVLPEGSYSIFLNASNSTYNDSINEIVRIDVTAPSVLITRFEPGIFAPDVTTQPSTLLVYFDVWNSPPGDNDQISISVEDPNGSKIADLGPSGGFSGNGSYQAPWGGAEITEDGKHRIIIIVTDNGGHMGDAWTDINIDNKKPSISISSPPNNSSLRTIPRYLLGWAWDRNGVLPDSTMVSYSGNRFQPVDSTYLVSDTLFFNVLLADSIKGEGRYSLSFKSRDVVGREASISFNVTFDSTPPAPPVLNQPSNRTIRKPALTLTGSFPDDADKLRIYRNDALLDSVDILLQVTLSHEVPLVLGKNVFKAVSVDKAGNASTFSNSIEVTFDDSPGLYIPQPFSPNNAFQINLSKNARFVSIRLYDLRGNLVAVLSKSASGTSVSVPWDGLNGDNKDVQRGPLVAVASIIFEDGEKETIRQVFLFKP